METNMVMIIRNMLIGDDLMKECSYCGTSNEISKDYWGDPLTQQIFISCSYCGEGIEITKEELTVFKLANGYRPSMSLLGDVMWLDPF